MARFSPRRLPSISRKYRIFSESFISSRIAITILRIVIDVKRLIRLKSIWHIPPGWRPLQLQRFTLSVGLCYRLHLRQDVRDRRVLLSSFRTTVSVLDRNKCAGPSLSLSRLSCPIRRPDGVRAFLTLSASSRFGADKEISHPSARTHGRKRASQSWFGNSSAASSDQNPFSKPHCLPRHRGNGLIDLEASSPIPRARRSILPFRGAIELLGLAWRPVCAGSR